MITQHHQRLAKFQCGAAAVRRPSELGEVPVPHGGVEGNANDVVVRRLQPRDAVRVTLQFLQPSTSQILLRAARNQGREARSWTDDLSA